MPEDSLGILPADAGFDVEAGFRDLKALGEKVDAVIVNLECPLTMCNEPIEKIGPTFRASPSSVNILKAMGVDVATLANNHILDFGWRGLEETLRVLGGSKIETVGAGMNPEDAAKIFYHQSAEGVVAIVNMAEKEFNCSIESGPGANPLDLIDAVSWIRDAASRADHIIVIVHGGLEYVNYPSPESVRVLRFLAGQKGVSAVVRHHPHCIQGHEVWNGVPIFYSIGNLFARSPGKVPRHGWHEGILVELILVAGEKTRFKIHPYEQCLRKARVSLLEGKELDKFFEAYKSLCAVLSDDLTMNEIWKSIVGERGMGYLGALVIPNSFLFRVLRKIGLLQFARPMWRSRRILENYLRCTSHRELLLEVLEQEREGGKL